MGSLRYYGGKSATNNRGIGKWIISMLPKERDVMYVETHGGMLGCLLGRPPARSELANDINARVVNWWTAVRDHTDEFQRLLRYTPCSESIYRQALRTLDSGSVLERALSFHIVVMFSPFHGDGQTAPIGISYSLDSGGDSASVANSTAERIHRIGDRLQSVKFENSPALDVLRRLEPADDMVVYVDPPYRSGNSTVPYSCVQHDYEATLETLSRQSGRVAVSGYGDDWEALGWDRHEYTTRNKHFKSGVSRTEVLWTNYRVPKEASVL